MQKSCCAAVVTPMARATPAAVALAVMLVMAGPVDAASIGHSRLVSAAGQPLRIQVPLRQLSAADLQSLRVQVAPLSAWQQAGLTPPVELSTLSVSVEAGLGADSRTIQVRSDRPFDGPVADLLLQVNTAAGSQQHQVSLLANTTRVATTAGQAGGGKAVSGAGGAASTSSSISVRKGDTLFALARAHAVEGVSVYQMMIALLKANPQAFIEGNINLVKAGARLSIPDAASLRAVSDREARRIFQQHAQAYAEYRQGIAGRRGQAAAGGSAQSGTLSRSTPDTAEPTPAAPTGDQVVLSSGSASSTVQDEREATQRNIDESQARVSQLERNVQSLNQALQMQGEAAKEAVLEGAATVSQTLSDAATSMGVSADSATAAGSAGGASATGAAGSTAGTGATATSSANGQVPAQAAAGAQGGGAASEPGASSSGAAAASGSAASAGASPQAGTTASADQASAATASSGSGSAVSGPGAGAGAVAAGTAAGSPAAGTPAAGSPAAGSPAASPSAAQADNGSEVSSSSKAGQSVSWFQENLLGVITAVLALVVLIIAWVLRRASASRGTDGHGTVTEAMVQERLDKIDLDLESPPADGRPKHTV